MLHCYRKMLFLAMLSFFILTQQSLGSDRLERLLKRHPTWSFELVSVERMIQDSLNRLKAVDPNVTEAMLRTKINASLGPETTHIVRKVGDPKWSKSPPNHFDAREEWKECASLINSIQDEGACVTDGPVVAASMAADRYCIHTNGTSKERLSAEMLAACAESCTKSAVPYSSFEYLLDHGIPTGGSYKSKQGCLPYKVPPCTHSNQSYVTNTAQETLEGRQGKLKPCEEYMAYDHECPKECSNPKYKKSLQEDLRQFTTWYYVYQNAFQMRNEIQAYGPMAARIEFYEDLLQYPEKGMYQKRNNVKRVAEEKFLKVIGWGEEEDIKYWLVMNTWDDWGKTKVFKIPRGIHYLDIEYYMMAGAFEEPYLP